MSVFETDDESNLYSLAEQKIETGTRLISQLDGMQHISGTTKLQKKIASEVTYLKKAISSKTLKINNILCSNLVHFSYLMETIERTQNVQSVDFPIEIGGNKKSTVRIDIVADNGATWIKVIARNPKALNDIAMGRSNFGAKSILDHANSYIEGANDNHCCFRSPKIIFDFANRIDDELKNSLTKLNIEVRIDGKAASTTDSIPCDIVKLNLDVTTLMAFVSSLTCESCDWEFDQPILTEQAERESLSSTKEILNELFQGKELIACRTSIDSFSTILNVVGGTNEKNRAAEFLKRIIVHPDLTKEEEESVWQRGRLCVGGKIRDRMFRIITFGMFHKALTSQAAKMQGFTIPSIVHEARALTEQKQLTAKYIKRK